MMVEPSVPPRVEWVSRFLLGGIFSPPKQTTHPTAYCQNIIRSVSPPFLPASCHNPPKRQHQIDKKAAAAPRYSRIFFFHPTHPVIASCLFVPDNWAFYLRLPGATRSKVRIRILWCSALRKLRSVPLHGRGT
jgi:hypothetical protein